MGSLHLADRTTFADLAWCQEMRDGRLVRGHFAVFFSRSILRDEKAGNRHG